jgi:chloramphenicol-sensitive protein RarD
LNFESIAGVVTWLVARRLVTLSHVAQPDEVGQITMANNNKVPLQGVIFSLSAGILWGIVPIFITLIGATDPYEIVAQRALWSAVILLGLCMANKTMRVLWQILQSPRLLLQFLIATGFLTLNWCIYVYAVQSEQVVAAAFGYFIYPLCTVLLSVIFLGEQLDRWAWVAITLVFLGVIAKATIIMALPWVSLMLAGSFSLYAVIRKQMNQDPVHGLLVETLILMPFVAGYLIWLYANGTPPFFGGGLVNFALAVTAGIITVVPLILFHKGNRALTMTMASLIFYSNPTTQLLIGVLLFGELFTHTDLVAFSLIWTGILIYFISRRHIARVPAPNI